MLPAFGVIDYVTAVFALPVTVAVNCCVCPPFRVAVAGASDADTAAVGVSVTVAVPLLLASAWLVAMTVTVCCVVIVAGAVYSPPALMLPAFGLIDHVTAVFALPVTVAVNCCVCPALRV